MIKIQGVYSYEFTSSRNPSIYISIDRLQNTDIKQNSGPIFVRVSETKYNKEIASCKLDPLKPNYGYAPLQRTLNLTNSAYRGSSIKILIYEKYTTGWVLSDTRVFDYRLKYDHSHIKAEPEGKGFF